MFDQLFSLVPWAAWPLLVAGFWPLVKGADFLVDGGSALAHRFKVPPLVIGLTIVAFGTSMPELVVNLLAAGSGSTDLAFGNVLGSNIFNILVILGISAVIYPIAVGRSTVYIEIPLVLLVAGLLFALASDKVLDGADADIIGRVDGIVLLLLFVLFMAYTVYLARNGQSEENLELHDWSLAKALGFVVLGIVLLILGGRLIVDSATQVARTLGMPERIIGLTIVSIGTSLPELATSFVAARKKQSDIAVGNVVGSNLFNSLLILGVTSTIMKVPVSAQALVDLLLNVFASLLLLVFTFVPRKHTINRLEGAAFLLVYVVYVVYLILAGA